MASLSEMQQSLKDKHWEEIKRRNANRVAKEIQGNRSRRKPINLNEGMADYNSRKEAEKGVQVKPSDIVNVPAKEEPSNEGKSNLIGSTTLFEETNTPSAPTARESERDAASKVFNSGRKNPATAQRIKRESAPVIDFEMLASRGYAEPTMRVKPGEGIVNPEAPVDRNGELQAQTALNEPKQRLGKDLMYSKAKENTGELAEQKPMAEPKQPNFDEMWANADDDTKAKFAEFLANNK